MEEKPGASRWRARYARYALLLLGALIAVGAWQGFGVLMYGIEGSYAH